VAELLALSCIDLAHIHRALGNDEQAREALQEAKQIFAGFSPWGVNMVAAYQARLDLARGEVESAERWAQASDLNIDDDLEFHREVEYLTLARVFMAQNRFEPALSLLGRLHQIAQTAGKMQSVLETLMLQAMALSAQGHTEQALIKLEQAFVIGEPENYVRLFVDEGQPMAELLRQAASHGLAPEYVKKLLAAFGGETKDEGQTLESLSPSLTSDSSSLIEPLSERELEILRLLKTELSGPEIARELTISLSTVRTHTKNIYSKLGVHNRRQAVARAENLGWL
jgi:LuxR family maltose regulon positive regulatory protein